MATKHKKTTALVVKQNQMNEQLLTQAGVQTTINQSDLIEYSCTLLKERLGTTLKTLEANDQKLNKEARVLLRTVHNRIFDLFSQSLPEPVRADLERYNSLRSNQKIPDDLRARFEMPIHMELADESPKDITYYKVWFNGNGLTVNRMYGQSASSVDATYPLVVITYEGSKNDCVGLSTSAKTNYTWRESDASLRVRFPEESAKLAAIGKEQNKLDKAIDKIRSRLGNFETEKSLVKAQVVSKFLQGTNAGQVIKEMLDSLASNIPVLPSETE